MKLLPTDLAGMAAAATALCALAATPAFAYDCQKIRADKHTFDLSPLKGPHSITTTRYHPPEYFNTTYTIDICAPLKHAGKVAKGMSCPQNTRVCAIEHLWDPTPDSDDRVSGVYPIAGDLRPHGGFDMDPEATRLSTSDSTDDSKKQGLRLVLKGGAYPLRSKGRLRHKAILEFICDKDREGTEGEWDPEDKYEDAEAISRLLSGRSADEDKDADGGDEGGDGEAAPPVDETQFSYANTSLLFESFKLEGSSPEYKVLRLKWYTKHACESALNSGGAESSSWGFFTWLVVIGFLGIASYLIFGSWLNYNRYGAQGWDLVPHGDTLRDVPYLLRDWARSLQGSLQGGGGGRGGYSAV